MSAAASHAAAVLACAVLAVLGAIHFYWAAGGRAGKDAAVPSKEGRPLFTPRRLSTVLVGLALWTAALLVVLVSWMVPAVLPMPLLRGATAILALIFCARALGDFRYVGFFKRVRGSVFAWRDTYLYSPLCLVLAALVGIVTLA